MPPWEILEAWRDDEKRLWFYRQGAYDSAIAKRRKIDRKKRAQRQGTKARRKTRLKRAR